MNCFLYEIIDIHIHIHTYTHSNKQTNVVIKDTVNYKHWIKKVRKDKGTAVFDRGHGYLIEDEGTSQGKHSHEDKVQSDRIEGLRIRSHA